MLKPLLYILPFFSPLYLFAQVYPDVEKRGVPISSKAQVVGDWRCIMVHSKVAMEDPPSPLHLLHFRFWNDTIWHMEYPCTFYSFSVVGDKEINKHPPFDQIRFLHDTLAITITNTDFSGDYLYVRDTFDQQLFDILVRDTLYLPSLFGKWYLQLTYQDPYSGEPPMPVIYPFYLPPIYQFDEKDIVNHHTIRLNINGTLRRFKVVRCSLSDGFFQILPDGWYHKPMWHITYFDRVNRYY